VRVDHFSRTVPLQHARNREFADSLLDQAGFEPSVPRGTTNFKEAAVCHLCRLPDFAPMEEESALAKGGRFELCALRKSPASEDV
jgi:hypothetical protein